VWPRVTEAAPHLAEPIKVVIADDHLLFVEALEAILSGDPRISVIGRASNGEEAVRLEAELEPDVVLMDISMPVLDGIEATRAIQRRRATACVLMLTGSSSSSDIDRARRAGAAGYITKDRIAADLIDAIVAVAGC
jgi:two-component system nitrate/nitrite response regulator NarL